MSDSGLRSRSRKLSAAIKSNGRWKFRMNARGLRSKLGKLSAVSMKNGRRSSGNAKV